MKRKDIRHSTRQLCPRVHFHFINGLFSGRMNIRLELIVCRTLYSMLVERMANRLVRFMSIHKMVWRNVLIHSKSPVQKHSRLHHIVAHQITCQASCRYTVQMTGSALLIRFTQVFDVTNTSHCSLGTFQDKLSIKSMYKIL